jgi:hypothetical protein
MLLMRKHTKTARSNELAALKLKVRYQNVAALKGLTATWRQSPPADLGAEAREFRAFLAIIRGYGKSPD